MHPGEAHMIHVKGGGQKQNGEPLLLTAKLSLFSKDFSGIICKKEPAGNTTSVITCPALLRRLPPLLAGEVDRRESTQVREHPGEGAHG